MSLKQREAAYTLIEQHAEAFRIERIDVPDIDAYGIGWANRAIFERLISALEADRYVVDGNLKLTLPPEKMAVVRSVIRADQTEQAVSAASIIAKVTRDRIMHDLHERYPDYRWDHNRGYGTAEHIAAIRASGASPEHRSQYIATALAKPPRTPSP